MNNSLTHSRIRLRLSLSPGMSGGRNPGWDHFVTSIFKEET